MIQISIRPCYADTDQMGFVHHSSYVKFYENARWEAFRSMGMPYKNIEANGILMPVVTMNMQFIKPAFYDDELFIRVDIEKIGFTRLGFSYTITREPDELISKAETTLAFLRKENYKPCRIPDFIEDILWQEAH